MRSVVQLYPGPPESGFEFHVSGFEYAAKDLAAHLKLETRNLKLRVGAVAQLGERLVCNQEATGSIPVSSTNLMLGVNVTSVIQFTVNECCN